MAFDETRKFDIIDDLKIEKFIKEAMAATGSTWKCRTDYKQHTHDGEGVCFVYRQGEDAQISVAHPFSSNNGKHIANFDPQTAILLCREILKLREENRELKEEVEYLRQDNMKMEDRIWELEGELEEKD